MGCVCSNKRPIIITSSSQKDIKNISETKNDVKIPVNDEDQLKINKLVKQINIEKFKYVSSSTLLFVPFAD